MDRKEFLQLMGTGVGGAALAACLGGCRKESNAAPARLTRDFTLDLSAPANAALAAPGGYLVTQQVIVAHATNGQYIAVAAACTHEGATIGFRAGNGDFRCPSHGATFNASGKVTGGPARTDLQQFNTQLSGNSLRVFS
jgi:cytochrome b6-f complex iron-sulfur subunit